MSWLTSSPSALAIVAAKAALMYVTALLGLRLGERRTLAQWTIIDFAAAVAMGAIVGRTAVASTQSYATGRWPCSPSSVSTGSPAACASARCWASWPTTGSGCSWPTARSVGASCVCAA